MSVRRDYCGMRLLVQVSGREAQILNRAPRGNGDVDRVTDRGRQRHPTAFRHRQSYGGRLGRLAPSFESPHRWIGHRGLPPIVVVAMCPLSLGLSQRKGLVRKRPQLAVVLSFIDGGVRVRASYARRTSLTVSFTCLPRVSGITLGHANEIGLVLSSQS